MKLNNNYYRREGDVFDAAVYYATSSKLDA